MFIRRFPWLLVMLATAIAVGDSVAPPARPAAFDLAKRKATQWAWQPVVATTPPSVKNASWAATPIDQFVLAKLEEKGLSPAPATDKRTLIRRACFDLTGLPPTPQAIDAFLADASPDAFEKVVDGLLASPHFGERWARHWMDLVRYAETYGHEFDYPISNAWRYRDYLIRAFNADVPYNQFVTEHVAGDLLADPRRNPEDGSNESILATAFWCFGEQLHAPVDVRQYQADCTDNQIDVFGKTFLGLTISCARCHDHKFDPIAQKDYYSLAGILESSTRQDALLDPHDRISSLVRQLKTIRSEGDSTLSNALAKPDKTLRDRLAHDLLAIIPAGGSATATLSRKDAHGGPAPAGKEDEAVLDPSDPMYAWDALAGATADEFEARREHAVTELAARQQQADESRKGSELLKSFGDGNYDGWRTTGWAFGDGPTRPGQWDALADGVRVIPACAAHSGMLGGKVRGVLYSPTFTLTRPEILYHAAGRGGRIRLIIDGYRMDPFNALLFRGASFAVNTGGKLVWHRQAQDVSRYVGHRAHIEIIDDGDGWVAVDEIRLADQGAPFPLDPPSATVRTLLEDPAITSCESLAAAYAGRLSDALQHAQHHDASADDARLIERAVTHNLLAIDSSGRTRLHDLKTRFDDLAQEVPEPVTAVALTDVAGFDEHVFVRGNYRTPGELAPRGFLQAIDGPHPEPIARGSGRLELARRMVDPSDPFVSRVMVNRLWHHLFGRGIVASVDNFGVMGSAPSHPELLDYLATEFMRDGWSVKKALRAMMLTRTYQMSSRPDDSVAEQADPDNVLLHRANVRRLEAEAIRDSILCVSGRLDDRVGGPSVDVFLTPFMDGRGRPGSGPLDGASRRSLYLAARRNFLSPMLLAFDMPTPFSTMGRRTVSNVPAQALILMNDPFVIEQAKLWASRTLQARDATPRQRIDSMYVQAFGRAASDEEFKRIAAFIDRQGSELGIAPESRLADPAIWTDLAHALLNTKEFIFLN